MTFIDDTEVRALELLTQAYIKRGHTEDSARAMSGHIELHEPAAFSAIVAALSQQPEARGVVDAALDLVRLVEGPGCVRWQDEQGFRLKDTEEWAAFYVAVNNTGERNG